MTRPVTRTSPVLELGSKPSGLGLLFGAAVLCCTAISHLHTPLSPKSPLGPDLLERRPRGRAQAGHTARSGAELAGEEGALLSAPSTCGVGEQVNPLEEPRENGRG